MLLGKGLKIIARKDAWAAFIESQNLSFFINASNDGANPFSGCFDYIRPLGFQDAPLNPKMITIICTNRRNNLVLKVLREQSVGNLSFKNKINSQRYHFILGLKCRKFNGLCPVSLI